MMLQNSLHTCCLASAGTTNRDNLGLVENDSDLLHVWLSRTYGY